jgi:FAD binding domain/Berberine and berberine like
MTTPITRRGSLKALGAVTVFAPALVRHASAQTTSLPPLPNLTTNDALLLQPGQPGYDTYEPAANERVLLRPKLRALCKTANAVSVMVNWCRSNNLPFAVRSGGHSYEGFSQSASVVIDTRMLNQITFDRTARTMTVGAGATLGPVYEAIGAAGFGFPGGSCPTVGVAGHALGGGFGLIARPFGLACDNLQWLELVDPQGAITQVDAQHNPDLFWAARGGGGGSFGAVTRFRFKIYRISQVVVLGVTWRLPQTRARQLFKAWQAWAPQAPANITTFLRVGHAAGGLIELHCAGQSIGSVAEFRRELGALTNIAQPVTPPNLEPMSFLNGAKHFFGGPAPPTFFKAKSDYITSPLTDAGVTTLLGQLETTPSVVAICDSYGGAINRVARDATAFAHRAGTLFCIQYFSEWTNAIETQTELGHIRTLYAAMRPYVSGECYVNYCDLDLTSWAQAYWGANLPRLRRIKAAFDPNNMFRHAQSVPVA